MLKKITKEQKKQISDIISKMTLQEKASQVLCWYIDKETPEEIKDTIKTYHLGSVFIAKCTKQRLNKILDAIKGTKIPVIVAGDLEHGAGAVIKGDIEFPHPMAVSAANSPELIEDMGLASGAQGRLRGFQWTFAPVVDLALNYNNPAAGPRAWGDTPEQVLKMVKPYISGIQNENRMAACCKHFPGDGLDDRDQHFCTSVNPLTRAQWFKTYGKVWQSIIGQGTMSIMVGHIALPFQDPAKSYLGPPPASLSKKIQIDLLRKKLGFKGLIVSDAIFMIGIASHVRPEELAVRNIASGSDMVLFADPKNDTANLLKAIKNKTISKTRINNAVQHVLELKARVGLLGDEVIKPITKEELRKYKKSSQKIAGKSVTLIRNENNLLPLTLKEGDKVLTVTIGYVKRKGGRLDLNDVDRELERRGLEVTHLVNPTHYQLREVCPQFKAVFINISVQFHGLVGTSRITGDLLMSFWRAFWMSFDNVVFTSFGSPYHLHELPSIPNYTNMYSNASSSQKAAVAFWLGEIKASGRSPVKLTL